MMVGYYNKAKQTIKPKEEYPSERAILKIYPNFIHAVRKYFNGRYYSFLEYAEKKKGVEKVCIICRRKFIAPFKFQRFRNLIVCSRNCRRNRHSILSGIREKECINCHRGFCMLVGSWMKYCSDSCRTEYRKNFYRNVKKPRMLMVRHEKNSK